MTYCLNLELYYVLVGSQQKKIINLMKYFLSVLYRTMSETSVETEDGREDIAIINENDTKQLARPIWKTSY